MYTLLEFKSSWHKQVIRDVLIKNKILIIFLLLLLAPTVNSLIHIVTLPAKYILMPAAGFKAYFLSLVSYQILSILWIYLQMPAFRNQPWQGYLCSLPIPTGKLLISEVSLLLISNFLIWLPLLIVFIQELGFSQFHVLGSTLLAERLIFIVNIVLSAQIICIKEKFGSISHLVLLNAIAVLNCLNNNVWLNNFLFLTSVSITTLLISSCYEISLPKKARCLLAETKHKKHRFYKTFFSEIKIPAKHLLITHSGYCIQSTLILAMVLWGIALTSIHYYGNKNYFFVLSCLVLAGTVSISNIFSKLQTQRNEYQNYFNTLPIGKWRLFCNDWISLSIVQVAFFIAAAITIYCITHVIKLELLVTFAVSIVCLMTTYYPQKNLKHYGQLVALTLMVMFALFNYELFNFLKVAL